MNKNEKKQKELSYYHLYLQKHLQENRFEQADDTAFIETRAELAASAYEQARRELLLFTPSASGSWWREYQKMAMYISAESIEEIDSPQERAAAELFKKEFAVDGKFITPSQIDRISYDNFDCIWIHIDRNGSGTDISAYNVYNSPEFIAAVRRFHEDGGNLYLSKFAVELLFSDGIGRLDDKFRPNIFSDSEGKSEGNIWCI